MSHLIENMKSKSCFKTCAKKIAKFLNSIKKIMKMSPITGDENFDRILQNHLLNFNSSLKYLRTVRVIAVIGIFSMVLSSSMQAIRSFQDEQLRPNLWQQVFESIKVMVIFGETSLLLMNASKIEKFFKTFVCLRNKLHHELLVEFEKSKILSVVMMIRVPLVIFLIIIKTIKLAFVEKHVKLFLYFDINAEVNWILTIALLIINTILYGYGTLIVFSQEIIVPYSITMLENVSYLLIRQVQIITDDANVELNNNALTEFLKNHQESLKLEKLFEKGFKNNILIRVYSLLIIVSLATFALVTFSLQNLTN